MSFLFILKYVLDMSETVNLKLLSYHPEKTTVIHSADMISVTEARILVFKTIM